MCTHPDPTAGGTRPCVRDGWRWDGDGQPQSVVGKPITIQSMLRLDNTLVGKVRDEDELKHSRELLQMLKDRVVSIEIVMNGDLEKVTGSCMRARRAVRPKPMRLRD